MVSNGDAKGTMATYEKNAKPRARHCGRSHLVITGVTLVVLVLSLGLGLGLGLKHHSSATSTLSPTTSSTPTAISTPIGLSRNIPAWRRDPSEYSLDMSGT